MELRLTGLINAFWPFGSVLRPCEAELPGDDTTAVAVGETAGNTVVIFLGVGVTIMDMEKLRLIAAWVDRERS